LEIRPFGRAFNEFVGSKVMISSRGGQQTGVQMFQKYRIRDFNFILVLVLVVLSVFSIMVVGSARESYLNKQIMGVIAGVVLMLLMAFIDYSLVLKFYWLIYVVNLILLLLVFFMGEDTNGATRWLELGGLQFQPSETAKIMLILFFAQFIMKHKDDLNTFKILCSCVILVAIPWVLIFKQPDLSTSIVVLVMFAVVMFAGGLSLKVVFGLLAILIPCGALLISLALQPNSNFLQNYQKNRILAFVNPEEYATDYAYQQLNSVMAIASGQLDGKGYRNNEVTSVVNGNFISEPQTDFIFAVVGEEFGFKGTVFVIAALMFIALECILTARRAKDLAGCVIAAGIGGIIAFQSFLNIGVTTFILPNTGLPLPFVSAGLSSQLSLFIGIGFVLNVRLQAKRN
jgi:rod shape determining protein RodA